MPYVDDHAKARLPQYPQPNELPTALPHNGGQLTYLITRQIQAYLQSIGDNLGYENLAVILGSLEGAKADFIDRVLLPYEHKKREQNGDVW